MTNKTNPPMEKNLEPRNGKRTISRRNFLKVSTAGAGALALPTLSGCRTNPKPELTPTIAQTPTTVIASNGGNKLSDAPQSNTNQPITPNTALETWIEPWVWQPSDWPGQQLHLNVVENENPGPAVGFGNPNAVLFSYGGITPGPTIRMRGDESLYVKLRNLLGQDFGQTPIGPNPDPNELTPELDEEVKKAGGNTYAVIPAELRQDFCLGEHANGLHSAHVTNLHTHGLHVRPGKNPDGTHSDNVLLRVISQTDFRRREQQATDPACQFLRDPGQFDVSRTDFLRVDEQVGEADSEFRLGNVMGDPNQPHPPGTHWYHPHAHGATHNQVASGMAGFLIVEGDVDAAINKKMTGDENPDPELKIGPYDYRERLMLIQRVFFAARDPDAPTQELKRPVAPAVNGSNQPKIITMRPGAVERWRVLNGSVDGRGFRRFMVLEGQYDLDANQQLTKYDPDTGQWSPVTPQEIENDKQQLYQLALDGITLVTVESGQAKYTIKDLAEQNAGTQNPLDGPIPSGENPNAALLKNYQRVFENGTTIKNCYVRPNEVYMGLANRTDVIFKAPLLPAASKGQVYTVLAKSVVVHGDNYQQSLQNAVATNDTKPKTGPQNIIVAHIAISGDAVQDKDFDVLSLRDVLPPVPPYLQPIDDKELRTGSGDSFRTRAITYSGWGSQDYPLVTTASSDPSSANFERFINADKDKKLENLVYARHDDVYVLLPSGIRTMAINGRKFDPSDPERPRMLVDSAEEWVIYNNSTMLWGNTDTKTHPQPGQFKGHYVSYPISRQEGQTRFDGDNQFQIVTKGVDHPFHIHQNPFWVTRIEIPDENGDLHNILDEPRWQDTIWIPRHRGRVVFRARFPDYVGAYVNHCHILLHEDNGMMQVVEATPFDDLTNYKPRSEVTSPEMSAENVSRLYPRLSPEKAYQQSAAFVDPNHTTGQDFPGFDLVPPKLT